MVKVGDKVFVQMNSYKVRGEIVKIDNDVAVVRVPIRYSASGDHILVPKQLYGLYKVPETLKELENLKAKRRG